MGLAREVKTVELGYPLPRQLRMLREVIGDAPSFVEIGEAVAAIDNTTRL